MRDVTDETFAAEVLGPARPVLVEFSATWCPPCRALEPVLAAIAADRADELEVVRLDADENPETAAALGVIAIPTMKLYQDGAVLRTIIGAHPRPALEAMLASALGGAP